MIIEENDIELIESEFEYANYLAQKELLDELALISIQFNETTILNEANIKGAIMHYIHKIVNNLQVAWNKFKRKITNTAWNEIKKTYEQELSMNRTLEIKQVSDSDVFVKWDEVFKFLSPGLRVEIYRNSANKEISADDIVKQIPYFNSIEKFSKQDMQQFVAGKCFEQMKVGNNIDLRTVTEYRAYLDKLDEIMEPIEDEIKIFNDIEKQVENDLKNKENIAGKKVELPGVKNPTTTPQPSNTQEAYNIVLNKAYEYLYMTEFKSEDKADPEGEETVKNGGNNLQKTVTTVMKVVTTYLSVKMWAANKATSKSLTLVLAYVRNAAKYNLNRKSEEKKKEKEAAKAAENNTGNQQ